MMEERKLMRLPREAGMLRAELRRFERERGVEVGEVRCAGMYVALVVQRLVLLAGLDVRVRVDEGVREGHVVVVG